MEARLRHSLLCSLRQKADTFAFEPDGSFAPRFNHSVSSKCCSTQARRL